LDIFNLKEEKTFYNADLVLGANRAQLSYS